MGFRISTEAARLDLDVVWAEIAVGGDYRLGAVFRPRAARTRSVTFWHPAFQNSRFPNAKGYCHDEKNRSAQRAGARLAARGRAQAADKLTLQLKWVAQAQFAGYYVAQAKGFYKAAGLDVTIKPGGPDINPSQVLAGGGADVIIDWMPAALAAREKGVPQVNIAQVFQRSGMELTCRKDSGVRTPADFKGKTLGVWFAGNEYPFLAWMANSTIRPTAAPNGVTVLKQGFNVDPLLQKQAACISTMTYNEYWQLIEAGMKPSQLIVFKYRERGRRDARGRHLLHREPHQRSRDGAIAWRASSKRRCAAGNTRSRIKAKR